jgi:glycosyltransferase involved in cell wall biosynthesis
VRVKNEARSLPYVLPGLLRAVERVVLIDNGSSDGTPAVARRVAEEAGAIDRLEIKHYPFEIARCGADHLGTPADSVNSLAYFYNWCFSHVRTTYVLKWDGDMVLSDAAIETLRDLAWQLEAGDAIIRIPRHGLYLGEDGEGGFLDMGLRNAEPWGWPNRPGYSFVKAMEWELPLWGSKADSIEFPEGSSLELKFLDADEFAHWTDTQFDRSARTKRKLREYEVFRALTEGAKPPAGVIPVASVQSAFLTAASS